MGKQDLGALQTRKMKGLKRSRDVEETEDVVPDAEELQNETAESKRAKV